VFVGLLVGLVCGLVLLLELLLLLLAEFLQAHTIVVVAMMTGAAAVVSHAGRLNLAVHGLLLLQLLHALHAVLYRRLGVGARRRWIPIAHARIDRRRSVAQVRRRCVRAAWGGHTLLLLGGIPCCCLGGILRGRRVTAATTTTTHGGSRIWCIAAAGSSGG